MKGRERKPKTAYKYSGIKRKQPPIGLFPEKRVWSYATETLSLQGDGVWVVVYIPNSSLHNIDVYTVLTSPSVAGIVACLNIKPQYFCSK